jgi:hypothetical protein
MQIGNISWSLRFKIKNHHFTPNNMCDLMQSGQWIWRILPCSLVRLSPLLWMNLLLLWRQWTQVPPQCLSLPDYMASYHRRQIFFTANSDILTPLKYLLYILSFSEKEIKWNYANYRRKKPKLKEKLLLWLLRKVSQGFRQIW